MRIDMRDATGAVSGSEVPVIDAGATGMFHAAVSAAGTHAAVSQADPGGNRVFVAFVELPDPSASPPGSPTVLVDFAEPTVQYGTWPKVQEAIPVFDPLSNDLVLFLVVRNNTGTTDIRALRFAVDLQTACDNGGAATVCSPYCDSGAVCTPLDDEVVVAGVSVPQSYAALALSGTTTPFLLAYQRLGDLHVAHVDQNLLANEAGARVIDNNASPPKLSQGPNGEAALVYSSSVVNEPNMLKLHRFAADTLQCTDQASLSLEACGDTVAETGQWQPSLAYGNDTWFVGHVTETEGFGVHTVVARGTDGGRVSGEFLESSSNPAPTHLAANDSGQVLVAKSDALTGATIRSLSSSYVCVCYRDLDGDGYGAGTPVQDCTAPSGYVTNNTDCYDQNASARPGQAAWFATDRGDGSFDYNCDGGQTVRYPESTPCWGPPDIDVEGFYGLGPRSCGYVGDWVISRELFYCDFIEIRTQTCR